MKLGTTLIAGLLVIGSLAMAKDKEHKAETTSDTSKNPITGTTTTTEKSEEKVKGPHGTEKAMVTKTTKHDKKGNLKSSETEVEAKQEVKK